MVTVWTCMARAGLGWTGLGWAWQGKWNVWLRVEGGGGWGWLCNLWFRYFADMEFYCVHLYFSQYKAKCMGEAPLPALSAYFRIWAFYADLWFCEHFRLSFFTLFLGAAGHHFSGLQAIKSWRTYIFFIVYFCLRNASVYKVIQAFDLSIKLWYWWCIKSVWVSSPHRVGAVQCDVSLLYQFSTRGLQPPPSPPSITLACICNSWCWLLVNILHTTQRQNTVQKYAESMVSFYICYRDTDENNRNSPDMIVFDPANHTDR